MEKYAKGPAVHYEESYNILPRTDEENAEAASEHAVTPLPIVDELELLESHALTLPPFGECLVPRKLGIPLGLRHGWPRALQLPAGHAQSAPCQPSDAADRDHAGHSSATTC